jgi:hypothetical protein
MIILYEVLVFELIIHEFAHINSAKEQNISLKLEKINWKPAIEGWGMGSVIPINKEECIKFNNLSLENKQKITHAGVNAELLINLSLLSLNIFILMIYLKKLYRTNRLLLTILIFINFILFVTIFFTLKGNVFTSNPIADWNLRNLSNCSIY